MNNLTNIVRFPTSVISHTKSLIDVIIVNYTNEIFTEILDFHYSDPAQLLHVKLKKLLKGPITTYNRHFTDNHVEEFKYLLYEEAWDEVLAPKEPNTAFNFFTNTFTYCFNTALPLKVTYVKGTTAHKWVSKGLIISKKQIVTLI
jgi:hypothetical protein